MRSTQRPTLPSRRQAVWPVAIAMIALLTLGACGTMVGAGVGGLAGNQFGKGKGKTAATAAGVVGGAVLGHALTGD